MSLLYFVVRVRCRRKESSRSLSHLLMSFLSSIATDVDYCKDKIIPELDQHVSSNNSAVEAVESDYSADHIGLILYRLRKTSTGSDDIPFWIFNDSASMLCEVNGID